MSTLLASTECVIETLSATSYDKERYHDLYWMFQTIDSAIRGIWLIYLTKAN